MSIEIIGKQIAELRREKNLKQEDIARAVGVSTQAVSKWENGGVPDVELLPKIADFFNISIDSLFGREISEYTDIHKAITDNIDKLCVEDRFKAAYKYCLDIESGLVGYKIDYNSPDFAEFEHNEKRVYSSAVENSGFTRACFSDKLKYFLIVPEPEDIDEAYFKGIDYSSLFRDLVDKDFFDSILFLYSRPKTAYFSVSLLSKSLNISEEQAIKVVELLLKYRFVIEKQIEFEGESKTAYSFATLNLPSFLAMLIFARDIITGPSNFYGMRDMRIEPYIK